MCSVSGTVGTMESLFFSFQISFKPVLRTTFRGSWTGPRGQVEIQGPHKRHSLNPDTLVLYLGLW